MNSRHLPAATALAAAAVLLLAATGCAKDSSGPGEDKIAGAEQPSGGAEPSASASEDASDGIDRPRITLPKDDVLVFEGEKTGDAKTDAVLRDNAELLRAIDEAIINQKPDSEAVAFYSKDAALLGAVEWISGFVKDGTTVTGTVRYFDRKVSFAKDGSAGLTYCADESKGFTKNIETQKIKADPVTKDSYVFYAERLRKNAKGIWQNTKTVTERGHQACQA